MASLGSWACWRLALIIAWWASEHASVHQGAPLPWLVCLLPAALVASWKRLTSCAARVSSSAVLGTSPRVGKAVAPALTRPANRGRADSGTERWLFWRLCSWASSIGIIVVIAWWSAPGCRCRLI